MQDIFLNIFYILTFYYLGRMLSVGISVVHCKSSLKGPAQHLLTVLLLIVFNYLPWYWRQQLQQSRPDLQVIHSQFTSSISQVLQILLNNTITPVKKLYLQFVMCTWPSPTAGSGFLFAESLDFSTWNIKTVENLLFIYIEENSNPTKFHQ